MNINKFFTKIKRKFKQALIYYAFQLPRILKYRFLSNCSHVNGDPVYHQPVQLLGHGKILFGRNVNLGFNPSPYLYSGYGYIDVRKETSEIIIGNDVWINNNFMLISEGEGITIGDKTLIGLNVEITDSDFHDLHPERRTCGTPATAKVIIGNNVFIGSNVKILKGVVIGDNTVIANGSIVTKSIPENVVAGGTPANIIKKLDMV